jgi:hypothetical protein
MAAMILFLIPFLPLFPLFILRAKEEHLQYVGHHFTIDRSFLA